MRPLLIYSPLPAFYWPHIAPASQEPTTKIPYYLRLLSYMLLDWAQILNGSGFLASVPSVAGSWGGRPGSGWAGGGGAAVSVDGAWEEWRGESEGTLRWLPWLSFLSSGCCGHSDESMHLEMKWVRVGWELENRKRWKIKTVQRAIYSTNREAQAHKYLLLLSLNFDSSTLPPQKKSTWLFFFV